MTPTVLLFATTTGYQTRAFGDAAAALGVRLRLATDRCHVLDDPWRDGAIAVKFHDLEGSVEVVLDALAGADAAGVLVMGDRPAPLAARVARALDLPWHPPHAAAAAGNKRLTRERLRAAGLRVPAFGPLDADDRLPPGVTFPCVVKPLVLSGSRGVMRADDEEGLRAAAARLRAILDAPDVRELRDPDARTILVESFVPGAEYALEALMHHGTLVPLALFDKPDPLDGPFFEETIYVTPSRVPSAAASAIERAVGDAAAALGLHHGPVHAEVRAARDEVCVLEVAARPIGGLCARALRFDGGRERAVPFESLLLRHATGEPPDGWRREGAASAVMMVPIPRAGIFRGVDGVEAAAAVEGVREIRITAVPDQRLVPLPEGASYAGFIFAEGANPAAAEAAVREAHRRLRFDVDREIVVRPAAG